MNKVFIDEFSMNWMIKKMERNGNIIGIGIFFINFLFFWFFRIKKKLKRLFTIATSRFANRPILVGHVWVRMWRAAYFY